MGFLEPPACVAQVDCPAKDLFILEDSEGNEIERPVHRSELRWLVEPAVYRSRASTKASISPGPSVVHLDSASHVSLAYHIEDHQVVKERMRVR